MRRSFKSIAAAVMVVIMLMTVSVPAMAAEQIPVMDSPESPAAVYAVIGSFQKTCMLTNGANLGTVQVNSAGNKIEATIRNASGQSFTGAVNLRIRNTSTGDFKQISVAANGIPYVTTFVTSFSAGTYEVLVDYVNPSTQYYILLRFMN